jgi:hypothetical protein
MFDDIIKTCKEKSCKDCEWCVNDTEKKDRWCFWRLVPCCSLPRYWTEKDTRQVMIVLKFMKEEKITNILKEVT